MGTSPTMFDDVFSQENLENAPNVSVDISSYFAYSPFRKHQEMELKAKREIEMNRSLHDVAKSSKTFDEFSNVAGDLVKADIETLEVFWANFLNHNRNHFVTKSVKIVSDVIDQNLSLNIDDSFDADFNEIYERNHASMKKHLHFV